MGGLLHLVQQGGVWAGPQPAQVAAPPRPLLAVPNVTAHSSTASVPITVLLYDGPLLCGFNVAIKGLIIPPVPTAEITSINNTYFYFSLAVRLIYSDDHYWMCLRTAPHIKQPNV